jgi:hypothetical protein
MTRLVGCSAAPPSFTFSGSITANAATTVTYHWSLPGGNGPSQTLTFGAAGTLAVASRTVAAASDNTSGTGRIVITSPLAITSNAAGFTVTCTPANISLSVSTNPSSPDVVACPAAPPFTLSGMIESSQSLTATYHWVLPDGSTTAPATVALTAGKGSTVMSTVKTGAAPFSGTATLQITSPANVSQSVPIDVTCTALAISANLPAATNGQAYSGSFTATGGSGEGYSWTITGLPTGLQANSATGAISGAPQLDTTLPATFPLTVTVTDSAGNSLMDSTSFSITVNAPVIP